MTAAMTTSLRVYVIDDDPDHVLIISRAIREVAPETLVRSIDDGAAAVAELERETALPDLILLDINMAGFNGFDVLSRVKSDARLRHIPVVMLTSSELSSDVARAYELGASGYISKPSYLLDLRAVLGNTLLYWGVMRRATA
ncbi:MAG TPA: response regulator [Chloroflexota bacterium]|nr:response regulator [Chloroflexota bacterium]